MSSLHPVKSKAFSLVELLTVITIMGVLMTAVAPAFRSISSSNNLVNGANILSALMNQARVHAIANSTQTAVYICTDWPGRPDDARRMASVWSWDANSATWKALTKWERLPIGVVVQDGVPAGSTSGAGEYFVVDSANLANEKEVAVNGGTAQVLEIRFNSLGAATVDSAAPAAANPLKQLQVRLIPGVVNAGTTQSTAKDNWIDVFTDGLTGRIRFAQR